LPQPIAAQVTAWETGARGPLDPREAAGLLWTLPVAAQLDGKIDAWRSVAGVSELLPVIEKLVVTPQADWPADQAALRDLTADLNME
jgi:hypothetical protein